MKTIRLSLCLALILCSVASAAELLWNNFDTSPTGSVANLPGWTRAAWLGSQTGRVVSLETLRFPYNVLELPWAAAGSSAVYTNFSTTYSIAQHPVIHFSAKLFVANTNISFQLGLRSTNTSSFLSFQSTNGYGSFGFLYHDIVFFPLITNRLVNIDFFYNRSNNHYRLDYDNSNRLVWATNSESGLTATQFNQFVATRLLDTASTSGELFIDEVSVETFPPHVWAWWRCTSVAGQEFTEELGTMDVGDRIYSVDDHHPGSSDPVWDGTADFRNEGATRQLVAPPTYCLSPTPSSSNWTVEAVFQIAPGEGNVNFLDWGRELGSNTNKPWIQFGYSSTKSNLYFTLRDAEQANTDSAWGNLGAFTPNGRWHHAALVKSNATLSLYLDYQPAATTNLLLVSSGTAADGSYSFDTLSWASIGRTLNGGNECSNGSLIDEVRISGKILTPSEFLQPGPPLIVAATNSALPNPWELTAKVILGKSYRAETSPSAGANANWQPVPGSDFTASYTFHFVDISSVPRTNFVRLVREN